MESERRRSSSDNLRRCARIGNSLLQEKAAKSKAPIRIESNDVASGVDPSGCVTQRARNVDRRERTLTQQKGGRALLQKISPYNIAFSVDPVRRLRKVRTGDINRRENAVAQYERMVSCSVEVVTHNIATRVHAKGASEGSAREINGSKRPFAQ